MKKSNIYTRTGDKGTTALIGGRRIPKSHTRLEAYGTADELNSFVGLLLSHITDPKDIQTLLSIQNALFVVGCELATDPSSATESYCAITLEDVQALEQTIDAIDALCGGWCGFILPGGSQGASLAHVCRTVCRRLERRLYAIDEPAFLPTSPAGESAISSPLLQYINRLSDYFFLLARKINFLSGIKENIWKNR